MTALSGSDRDQLRQQLAEEATSHRFNFGTGGTGFVAYCRCGRWEESITRATGRISGSQERWREHVDGALLPVVEAHTRAARADELAALSESVRELHNGLTGRPAIPYARGRADAYDAVRRIALGRAQALRTHEGDTP